MRRLVFISGIATVALLCSSCINFGTPVTGSIGAGPTVDTGPIATADVDLRDGSGGIPEAVVAGNDGKLWWMQRCLHDECVVAGASVTPPAGVNDLASG